MSTNPADVILEAEVSDSTGVSGEGGASRSRLVVWRFFRNKTAVFGLALLIFLFLLAFLGPYIGKWDYKNDQDFMALAEPPSSDHWFGTTQIGEDVFAQTVRGMQKSLIIGLLVALFATTIAAAVGSCAAYFGGIVDRILMWVVDLLLVLPGFLIVAILSPTFRGKTWLLFVVLLGAFSWMVTGRAVRGMTLSLREREYVLAARYMGVPPRRIIARHILPNMASFLIVDATLQVAGAIIGEAGLSFFGFGIQSPDVSLGTLIASGQRSADTRPWLFAFCGGLLFLILLAVNFVGDGLRDALDPNAQGSKAR